MDLGLIGVIGSVLAGVASLYAIVVNREKVEAEAESVTVATSDRLLSMVRGQLDWTAAELTKLREQVVGFTAEIEGYRRQVEAATRSEAVLKKEVGRLRKRVGDLEQFIIKSGLSIPSDTEEPGGTYPNNGENNV